MKNEGITLVAMIATVVIMIVIAGVSISLVVGNNNTVITEAEEAVYKNSITQIEQKINEFYINNYNDMPELDNKALSLILYLETDRIEDDSIYKENWVDNNEDGHIFHKFKNNYKTLGDYTDEKNQILSTQYQTWTEGQTSTFELSWLKEVEIEHEQKAFYLLNSKNLDQIFGSEVEVLETASDYNNLVDVYAITSDLRVFYIANRFK